VAARVVQSAGDARLEIDLAAGCRLASLQIGGREILVGETSDPIAWGCYPMAPYAGRVREGRFTFHGRAYELPRLMGGHAIHGTAFLRPWEADGAGGFATDLGPDWPFPGWIRQELRLDAGGLDLRLEVHAASGAMPASCGWHPWFRRSVAGASARLDFRPGFMLARDEDGITTPGRLPVVAGPWDDCFGEVTGNPALTWPGVLRVELESNCPYWVAFTARDHAWCLEPQTAPPDALNHQPFIVEPGRPLSAALRLRWSPA
jgi:aldose 1-epimerase